MDKVPYVPLPEETDEHNDKEARGKRLLMRLGMAHCFTKDGDIYLPKPICYWVMSLLVERVSAT